MGTSPATGDTLYFPGFEPSQLNAHLVLFGTARSGRSTTAALRILRRRPVSRPVIIIDAHGTHTQLVKRLRGTTFRPGELGQGLNPFATDAHGQDPEDTVRNVLMPKLHVLTYAVLQMAAEHATEQALDFAGNILARLYHQKAADPNAPDPTTESLITLLDSHARTFTGPTHPFTHPEDGALAARMAKNFTAFLNSPNASLLGPKAPRKLPAVTSFDLSHLDEETRPLAATLCLQAAWTAAVQDPGPRLLVIDDTAPLANAHTHGAAALANVHRRGRPYKLALTTLVHDTASFLDQPDHSGTAVLRHSAAALVLRHPEHQADALDRHLDIPPGSETGRALRMASPGQGLLISHGGIQDLIKIRPSAQERNRLAKSGY